MDMRFERVWQEIEARRRDGASLDDILAASREPDLIAALAVAGARDPVAANVIATHMLNRHSRAPFLGAFLVSTTTLVVVYAADFVIGGDLLHLTGGPLSLILGVFSFLVAIVSGASFIMWRGGLRHLRTMIVHRHAR